MKEIDVITKPSARDNVGKKAAASTKNELDDKLLINLNEDIN